MADISHWLKIRPINHVAQADEDGLYLTPSGQVWRLAGNRFTHLEWDELQAILDAPRIPRQRNKP